MSYGAEPPSMPSRLTSFGLVAALHGLILFGLSAGLIRDALRPPPGPTQVEVLKPEPPPPEPPLQPPRQPDPTQAMPRAIELPPVPDIVWQDPPESAIAVRPADAQPAVGDTLPPRDRAPDLPPALASEPVSAGLLCPTMSRPELPALAQQGTALLRVLGTVRGGRVVAVQTTTLQALPDRRAQRALLAHVEQALRSGYACTQDGQFEQEFLFRVD